jgi:hypothetical protein
MDVFAIRQRIVTDYANYVQSFASIGDHVQRELGQGVLWPEPLLQVSPSYEAAHTVDELVTHAMLHPQSREVFALRDADGNRRPLRLHRHQEDALRVAATGESHVLTTGAGSGKSLAYVIPIVDAVLRRRTPGRMQAIIVYPMNALVNSQADELDKFLKDGDAPSPVTYRRYTGQESIADRDGVLANPPGILPTNYVMLELHLTRMNMRRLVNRAPGPRSRAAHSAAQNTWGSSRTSAPQTCCSAGDSMLTPFGRPLRAAGLGHSVPPVLDDPLALVLVGPQILHRLLQHGIAQRRLLFLLLDHPAGE